MIYEEMPLTSSSRVSKPASWPCTVLAAGVVVSVGGLVVLGASSALGSSGRGTAVTAGEVVTVGMTIDSRANSAADGPLRARPMPTMLSAVAAAPAV